MSTADLSSDLFPLTLESFSGLGHEARLRAFSRMLDLCSHRDHVALHEELEARLARDFLTLLPPEIAVMILSYLPLKGLITGMHVCRRWREIISGATADSLWKNAANEIGLNGAIVKKYLPECGSYSELTLLALSHRKCVSSYVPDEKVEVLVKKCLGLNCMDLYMYQTYFQSAGCYVICKDLFFSTTTLKRMSNNGSLVSLHTFNHSRNLGAAIGPFAPINYRDFVFWGHSETGWIGWSSTDPPSSSRPPPCKIARTDMSELATDTGLQVWSTNELTHCSTHNTAVCPNCGLIAVFGLHVSSHRRPSVLLRKLTPGESTVDEVGKCTLKLPGKITPDVDNMDEFSMSIFPKEFDQGVCGRHYLLVHCEQENLLSVHLVPADLSCVFKLPIIRLPTELAHWTGKLWIDVCSSTDGSVVAFCGLNEEQYSVWEPESGRVVSVCLPNLHFRLVGYW